MCITRESVKKSLQSFATVGSVGFEGQPDESSQKIANECHVASDHLCEVFDILEKMIQDHKPKRGVFVMKKYLQASRWTF